MRLRWWLGVLAAGVIVLPEAGARLAGLTSFPLYERRPGVEYQLAPSQRGAFMRKNRWFVNEAGFNDPELFVPGAGDCGLIGDSVVYGGNPVDYADRVGTTASGLIRSKIWTGAAGGWSVMNEISFVKSHRLQLSKLRKVIFVLNNGDFDKAATWSGETSFPTYQPTLATWYLTRRYLLPHASELPPIKNSRSIDDVAWKEPFLRVVESVGVPVVIIYYVDRKGLSDGPASDRQFEQLQDFVKSSGIDLMLVDSRPYWSDRAYRDGIHPNSMGNAVLARIVGASCR